ncbi:L,D-transpeptidase [Anaerobacillus sp. MEB173]|uniref:L,D-transpeptidase n=1 Tax=Anaerobacillus sp. MEB173 TaxID=3383345 RepID=UPI003F9169EF
MVASPLWPLGENPLLGDPLIIVNKQTNKLAFINDGKIEKVVSVATGKEESLTPEGEFTITVKAIDPYYRKKNIEGGAKENPLGTRWMGFDAEGTDGRIFGIHGNNNPASIGHYLTNGCIRMYEEDVQELFEKVPLGTKVLVVKNGKSFEELAREQGAIY